MTNHSPNPLPPSFKLGYVHLTVTNLENSLAFYQNAIGLKIHRQEGATARLGVGADNLLVLTEIPAAVRVARTTGLYHFALVVPSRKDLGGFIQNLIDTQTSIQGAADHNVSEAIYLPDPDGNGIEVYRDRLEEDWQYDSEGAIKMGNFPLDVDGILGEGPKKSGGLAEGTTLGHMHLHVAQIEDTLAFYRDVLGFDLMVNWGGQALFMAVAGYHHHMGLNTWNGVGAAKPPENSVGLRYFSAQISQTGLNDLKSRLDDFGHPYHDDGGLMLQDPAGNGMKFIE